MKVDVFICTIGLVNDGTRNIKRCVYSILNNDIPINRFTILAKTISRDLKTFCEKNKIILKKQEKSKPLGYHRAKCILESRTTWCLFVDDDVYLPYGWFDHVKKFLKKGGIVAVQGVKKFEKRDTFDVINSTNNLLIEAKSFRHKKERGSFGCSFENTLINCRVVINNNGNKILETYDSGEDWTLNYYMSHKGYKWIVDESLRTPHNSISIKKNLEKIKWYSKSYNLKKSIISRILVSLLDLSRIFYLSFKKIIFYVVVCIYTILIYIFSRIIFFKNMKKTKV